MQCRQLGELQHVVQIGDGPSGEAQGAGMQLVSAVTVDGLEPHPAAAWLGRRDRAGRGIDRSRRRIGDRAEERLLEGRTVELGDVGCRAEAARIERFDHREGERRELRATVFMTA